MYVEDVDIVLASSLNIVGNWTYAIAGRKRKKENFHVDYDSFAPHL
jgi:hypothetical protein